jgi:hypothetical protein
MQQSVEGSVNCNWLGGKSLQGTVRETLEDQCLIMSGGWIKETVSVCLCVRALDCFASER